MNKETEQELRNLIAEQRARLEKLEADFRSAGRDLDDRFRAAVDPIGEKFADKVGLRYSRTTQVAIRVVVIVVVVAAIGYLIYRVAM